MKCQRCDQKFDDPNSLIDHQTIIFESLNKNPNIELKSCSVCSYKSCNMLGLLCHKQKQHPKVARDLKNEKNVPSTIRGDKPFKCGICPKTFTNDFLLQNHIRVHTGEKPFKCEMCQQLFSQKMHLANHMLKHKNEKPNLPITAPAEEIPQNIIENSNLPEKNSTNSSKNLTCSVIGCEFETQYESWLNRHMESRHSNKNTFMCKYCPQSFLKERFLTGINISHENGNFSGTDPKISKLF